jgi:rubrerythrin
MRKNSQVGKILEFAIEKEEAAHKFYVRLGELVSDASTRDTLDFLAREEAKHKEFLERYLRGEVSEGALRLSQVVEYKILEHLEEEPVPSESLSPQEAFLLAAKREQSAHLFYGELSRLHPAGPVKELLARMANEELRHKEKVEYLYANTAFPQTSGG